MTDTCTELAILLRLTAIRVRNVDTAQLDEAYRTLIDKINGHYA